MTPPSLVSLPPSAAPASCRDRMTPGACRCQGESCSYCDMAPRHRRSAAVCLSLLPDTHTTWSWWNIYPVGGTGQHVTAAMAAARRRCRRPPPLTPTFYRHWLPQAQNSEPKAFEGRWRRRARWGETKMSEGAGSYNISGRRHVSVCCPLQALRRKAQEAKRWGSA